MNKQTFSPWPWEVERAYMASDFEIRGKNCRLAARIYNEADAHVFAAGLEMFEALSKWQAANALGDAQLLAEARLLRDAAIAKAQGGDKC